MIRGRGILSLMLRAACILLVGAALLAAADVTGTWQFEVETSQGSGSPTFTFKQEGEKLSGTYTGLLGKAEVSGTVKGDKIEFSFTVSQEGISGKIRYWGVIESATRMKGEAEFAEFGKATWTATKK